METTSDFSQKLFNVWRKSVMNYEQGNKDIDTYFDKSELDFLSTNGIHAHDIFDYAEDFVQYKEPDFAVVLLIEEVRRAYFLEEQKGVPSTNMLSVDYFPKKTETLDGTEWLPRCIEKARAKLHGELPSKLMYCCGSVRACLKDNNIHPAELMRAVWFYEKNPDQKEGLTKWVLHRRDKSSHFLGSLKKLIPLK